MCAPVQRVFFFYAIFIVCCDFYALVSMAPIVDGTAADKQLNDLSPLLELVKTYNDYDVHYNQRQDGKINLRTKLNGFIFIIPEDALYLGDAASSSILDWFRNFNNRRKLTQQQSAISEQTDIDNDDEDQDD